MCDFAIMEKALKIAWIKRIQNEVPSSWKIIPDVMVQQHGNLFFLTRCNYDLKMLSLENLFPFYRSILLYWHDFKKSKKNEVDFENEILWNNRNILIDGPGTSGNGDGRKLLSFVWVPKQTCENHKKNGRERPGNEEENG